jgi:uncharacterized protein YegP (UPF0339 family)
MMTLIALVLGFFAGMFWSKYRSSKLVKLLKEQLNNALTLLKDEELKTISHKKDAEALLTENSELKRAMTAKEIVETVEASEDVVSEVVASSVLDHVPAFEAKKMITLKVYLDGDDSYRWQIKAKNNKIIADSGEGYTSMQNLEKALNIVRDAFVTGGYKVSIEK